MEKFAQMALLLDVYGELLTPKQRDVMDFYYNYDLSLAEIAEQYGISRQGVYDLIKRAEQTLTDFEQKIGAIKRWIYIEDVLRKVVKDMDAILNEWEEQKQSPKDIKHEIQEWKDALEKVIDMKFVPQANNLI